MSPYRENAIPAAIVPVKQPWLKRTLTRARRKLRLWWAGPFKDRFPLRCDVCGKPSTRHDGGGDTIYIQNNYDCGHEYIFWRELRAMRVLRPKETALRKFVPGSGVARSR